jgi:hypothetical protein
MIISLKEYTQTALQAVSAGAGQLCAVVVTISTTGSIFSEGKLHRSIRFDSIFSR